MIPEFGHFALIIALAFALVQSIVPMVGVFTPRQSWCQLAKPTAVGQFFFLIFAMGCLTYAFITHDFSVGYVAENSSLELPLMYRIAAVWGAHEGSLLLWVTVLSAWTVMVCFFSRALPEDIKTCVISILGMISVGFLIFLLLTSNPFWRLLPDFPPEGRDLNPLLQDPGMAIHPPMLYMGYVGFAVTFALAIAALLRGQLDVQWARWSRPWALAAWIFLTLGITLGSGWAYRVLGWGGWWFWDPVENASFLPWLTGTALIHSLIVVEKRDLFKSWVALLAICAFSLSLMGTFLVRSGVLTSVHSFAADPTRGAFMLGFLAVVIGGALLVYAWRAPLLRNSGNFDLISRETFLLINNVMLVAMMLTVLLGTLYPLTLDALNLGKISVGAPYFNTVFVPMMLLLLLFMGIAPLCQWQHTDLNVLRKRLLIMAIAAIIISLIFPWWYGGALSIPVILGMGLASWVLVGLMLDTWRRSQLRGWMQLPLQHWGMVLAHLGVIVLVIGITLTSNYHQERDVRMSIGDHVQVGPYDFYFAGIRGLQSDNYQGMIADFKVSKSNKSVTVLNAERRLYQPSQAVLSHAAIDAGVARDLYVALGEPLSGDAWGVRIYYKPFVRWIWAGGILMMLGGIAAAIDKRYRPR